MNLAPGVCRPWVISDMHSGTEQEKDKQKSFFFSFSVKVFPAPTLEFGPESSAGGF